jgi:adenylate cyclase ExoY
MPFSIACSDIRLSTQGLIKESTVIGVTNQDELELLIKDATRLGYIFYANRLWSQRGKVNSNPSPLGPNPTYKQDYQFDTLIPGGEFSRSHLKVFTRAPMM